MRFLLGCFALVIATQSVGLAQRAPSNARTRVDWARLGKKFAEYVHFPSSANASAVRALLPTRHVALDGSEDASATSLILDQGLPILERQVEARDSEAVRLALDLYAVTDGEAEEQLDMMLGKLISIDPRLFLVELRRREQRTGQLIGVEPGNLGPDFVDRTEASCLELRSRVSSLEQVNDAALRTARARFLEALNNEIRDECR